MLTHANLVSNAIDSRHGFETLPTDVELSVLPLAHVYGRVVDYSYIFRGVAVAYVEQIETVAQALNEVHPTVMAAVPRLYEKMYANIIERGHRETGIKRWLFDWAIRTAVRAAPWRARGGQVPAAVKWQWQAANALVYAKIRSGVGGQLRYLSSGGAPISAELIEFFWSIGLPVYQGYGLTETSPVVSANNPQANKIGTVGRPIAGVEVRIAEDGEILVKGQCVMQGYYQQAGRHARSVHAGWLVSHRRHRRARCRRLSDHHGPQEGTAEDGGREIRRAGADREFAEDVRRSSTTPWWSGDRRKFVSVLIVPNFPARGSGGAQGRPGDSDCRGRCSSDPWVRDLIQGEIERLTAKLAQYEKPKRFALLEQDFTYAGGELTYTLKLKRRVIEERYQDVIERLYADVEEPRPARSYSERWRRTACQS